MCLFFPSFSTWHGRPGVYVQDIFVEQRFRGLKVGEALLQRCAALTRAQGGDLSCGLLSMSDNFAAQGFYERLGISHRADRAHPCRLRRRVPGAGRRRQAQRTRHGMKAFYADEQKRHDPKAFLSSGAPQPNPGKARACRAPARRRARRGLDDRSGRRTSGWGRSPPSTRPNISISSSTFLCAGSASRARRPK